MADEERTETDARGWIVPAVLTIAAAVVIFLLFLRGGDEEPEQQPAAPFTQPADLKVLPVTSTKTTIEGAPLDQRPKKRPDGTVVHPRVTVPVYDAPEGTAIARLKPRNFGDTWLPVIAREGEWMQVLLPSKPNGSTGWLWQTPDLELARSSHVVRIHLGSRRLELREDGRTIGEWPVAIGAADTPTPIGRTFVLGQLIDDKQSFSPVILPLGTHSDTLDSYGGGPGTVALHGWTDPSVFGKAVSHGCVRVPDEALRALRVVPLGSPVLIDRR